MQRRGRRGRSGENGKIKGRNELGQGQRVATNVKGGRKKKATSEEDKDRAYKRKAKTGRERGQTNRPEKRESRQRSGRTNRTERKTATGGGRMKPGAAERPGKTEGL